MKFYDYEAKYAPGGSEHLLPAPVAPEVYEECRRLSLAAHRALGCRGITPRRLPLRRYARGTTASLPGGQHPARHDRTSLVPEMAQHAGISFEELVRWMVEDASLDR